MAGVIVPPASPGYHAYSNGLIVVSAGAFVGAARAGLVVDNEAIAPGPSQVSDTQVAANYAAAAETLSIPLDTIEAVTNRSYYVIAGYRCESGLSNAAIGATLGSGTNIIQTNPALFVSPWYGTKDMHSSNSSVAVKTGTGQTLTIKAYHTAGSGKIFVDVIYLMPTGHTPFGGQAGRIYAASVNWQTVDAGVVDEIDSPGSPGDRNGMFYGFQNNGLILNDPQVTDTPSETVSADQSYMFSADAKTYHAYSFVRSVVDGDTAKLRLRIGNADVADTVTLPDNPNVYLIKWSETAWTNSTGAANRFGLKIWVPAGQTGPVRVADVNFLATESPSYRASFDGLHIHHKGPGVRLAP